MPSVNFAINEYATVLNPFAIINRTGKHLEDILDDKLIVNTEFNGDSQPLVFLNNSYADLLGYQYNSGMMFESWRNATDNALILLYNDSALLGMPYLLNTLAEFYSNIEDPQKRVTRINASLGALPMITYQDDLSAFDAGSFSSLIILGIGMVIPAISFAAEIVHDREVNVSFLLWSGRFYEIYRS